MTFEQQKHMDSLKDQFDIPLPSGISPDRPRCWQCNSEMTAFTIGPFCSLDCEYEYNKVGF